MVAPMEIQIRTSQKISKKI